VVEGLLLDGIDTEAAGEAISIQYDLILPVFPHVTEPLLTRLQLTVAGTEIALNPAVWEFVPVFGRKMGGHGTSLFEIALL
jgi:hypothetical protein